MKTVYLAGGMKRDWRSIVKMQVLDFRHIDPCDHELEEESQYTLWDLEGIRASDYVFAYMEEENPSGLGLALEIGYAKGLNKTVIFVDEKHDKRLGMARTVSDVTVGELKEGIYLLSRLALLDLS